MVTITFDGKAASRFRLRKKTDLTVVFDSDDHAAAEGELVITSHERHIDAFLFEDSEGATHKLIKEFKLFHHGDLIGYIVDYA